MDQAAEWYIEHHPGGREEVLKDFHTALTVLARFYFAGRERFKRIVFELIPSIQICYSIGLMSGQKRSLYYRSLLPRAAILTLTSSIDLEVPAFAFLPLRSMLRGTTWRAISSSMLIWGDRP